MKELHATHPEALAQDELGHVFLELGEKRLAWMFHQRHDEFHDASDVHEDELVALRLTLHAQVWLERHCVAHHQRRMDLGEQVECCHARHQKLVGAASVATLVVLVIGAGHGFLGGEQVLDQAVDDLPTRF